MDRMQGDRRRGRSTARRAIPRELPAEEMTAPPPGAPCGACKFLRRKCIHGCIFAPYFGSDQGAAKFAAVHMVFGASNVSKLLLHIPVNKRQDAVVTITYEAQARLADPVYGCVSTILALQQQVATLQAELSLVQTQLMSSRYAVASAFQAPEMQQPQPAAHPCHLPMLQPEYSNSSATSNNNFINISSFAAAAATATNNFAAAAAAAASSHTLEPLPQFPHPPRDEDEGEDEAEEEEEGEAMCPPFSRTKSSAEGEREFLGKWRLRVLVLVVLPDFSFSDANDGLCFPVPWLAQFLTFSLRFFSLSL